MSVLYATGPTKVQATKKSITGTNYQVISAATLASVHVDGGTISKLITFKVSATYVAEPEASTSNLRYELPRHLAIWATIGSEIKRLQMVGERAAQAERVDEQELGDNDATAMGVPTALRTVRVAHTFDLAHTVSASEASGGFDVVLSLGLLTNDRDPEQTGAHLLVDSIAILGQ